MSKTKKCSRALPARVYAQWDGLNSDDPGEGFLRCDEWPEGATDTETSGDGPKVGECVGVYELVRIVRLEVKTEITEHPAK